MINACISDSNDFEKSHNQIYPTELELKLKHSGNHATFLNLDITLNDVFIHKFFDKRDAFPFFIVGMPHLDCNIPTFIFYGTFLSETLRIARCTLLLVDFLQRLCSLLKRMIYQGGSTSKLLNTFERATRKHPEAFVKIKKTTAQLVVKIKECISAE